MSSIRYLSTIGACLVLLAACGGGGGGDDDTGPCLSASFSQQWPLPLAGDAEFCTLAWDNTKPEVTLTECGEVFERCSDIGPTPNFSCLDDPPGEPPATPATVTLTGFVDVFSSGPNSDKAQIQVFRESDLDGVDDILAVTPLATFDIVLDDTTLADARACPKQKDFMQGQCVTPTNDCGGGCDKDLQAGSFCYETTCEDLQRWEVAYSIPGLPTNEFLVVHTIGVDSDGTPQPLANTWSPMAQYNVYMATNDRACDDALDRDCIDTVSDPPQYQMNVNLLSSQDYMTIPTSAGLSAGITVGNGAFAGEVHDCDGSRVQHAQVGFTVARDPRVLVYFNGNVVKTLPRLQQAAQGTNSLGLYSGLDLPPGPMEVVAIGVSGGELREIGRFAGRVWPNTVSLVRINGGSPAR